MLSEAKHLWLCIPAQRQKYLRFFASLRMTKCLQKNPDRKFDPGLKCYPADAVQADHPFPSSNGWMTVAAASDFQSRPVMFCDNPAS
jgi:hypothetical protein